MKQKMKLFLVDDDAVYLKTLEVAFLEQCDFDIQIFSTGELCIKNLSQNPDVVILDYHLNGLLPNAMNGIKTLDEIKKYNPEIPVIILSSQDKIEVAVQCMHHEATDYVVKSETAFVRLKKIIIHIFLYKNLKKELTWYMDRM